MTGLEIAQTLVGPDGRVLVIDTEKESALTYADTYRFTHLPWAAPYNPQELAATVTDAGTEYDLVFVDSASHFWSKEGGTVSIADGRFGGWKDARPVQELFVDAILGCQAHVILSLRQKQDYVQEQEGGRTVVRKLGMASMQDGTLEYELNVAVSLDMTHRLHVDKSRTTACPVGREYFGPAITDGFAASYREWLEGGEPPLSAAAMADVQDLIGALAAPLVEYLKKTWQEAALPPLRAIRASDLDRVTALIGKAKTEPEALVVAAIRRGDLKTSRQMAQDLHDEDAS